MLSETLGAPDGTAGSRAVPSAEERVRMADGVRLATDVYLPPGARGRVPAVLVRTPYGKREPLHDIPLLTPVFHACGYAVVAQDVRGKYASEGKADPFVQELVDGARTVEWICSQPWCNGAIVPYGDSYPGFTALAAAASGHAAIRGVVPRVTTSHVADAWMYRQGVLRLQQNGQWALFAWGNREKCEIDPDWSVRPLSAVDTGDADPAELRRCLRMAADDAWWSAQGLRAPFALAARASAPMLLWSGWWDVMVHGSVDDWRARPAGAGPRSLVIGATDHDFNRFAVGAGKPPEQRSLVDGMLTAGPHQPVVDFLRGLNGDGEGGDARAPAVRWELANGGGWHESDRWPPPESRPARLYLADGRSAGFGVEGGALAQSSDRLPTTVSWHHDPADLVPSLDLHVWGPLGADLPDQRDVQMRDDVLNFSGPPVAGQLDLAGDHRLRLQASTSARRGTIVATLSDVWPEGRALRIAEGVTLVHDAHDSAEVEIAFGVLAYRIPAGHRLRLSLAASSYPRYLWLPEDGRHPWGVAGGRPAEFRVRLGRGSFLELAVWDGAAGDGTR